MPASINDQRAEQADARKDAVIQQKRSPLALADANAYIYLLTDFIIN